MKVPIESIIICSVNKTYDKGPSKGIQVRGEVTEGKKSGVKLPFKK